MSPDVPEPTPFGSAEVVATGSRREEMHYEADPGQLVVARATVRPGGPIPTEERSAHPEAIDDAAAPIEDVRVLSPTPSVWDARPPEAGAG